MKRLSYFAAMAWMIFLSGCSNDSTSEATAEGAIPFGINPTIAGAVASRLDVDGTNSATAGTDARDEFVEKDQITLTKIARTSHPVDLFTYTGLVYNRNSSKGWDAADTSKKIYWTDTNEHTIIGYSLAQGTTWASESNGTYTRTLSTDQTDVTKFKSQDALLSYSDAIKASPTTSLAAADIEFYHGLAKVRTEVALSGFAATSTSTDTKTNLTAISITGQPTTMTWSQTDHNIAAIAGNGENSTIKLWNALSQGSDNDKLFIGYGLVVAGKRDFNISMTVTYPSPLDETKTLTDTYNASFKDITFIAGKRTTVTINLNHQNGTITAQCTFTDWTDHNPSNDAADDELNKYGTFLQTVDMANIKLATAVTTVNAATWLYTDGTTVKDRYGNDGTAASPYEIRNAYDMLALAKEVNNGRTFVNQYVKLSADQYLQPSASATTLSWPGIGDGSNSFAGTFLGDGRVLYSLNGNPLFYSLASTAKVSNLTVRTNSGSVNATTAGILCGTNNGRIEGCATIGKVSSGSITGGIAGVNAGTILASYHQGAVNGTSAGGLIGTNSGTIAACYQGLGAISGTNPGGICSSNTGTITSCYYDKTAASAVATAIKGTADTSDVKGMNFTDMEGMTFVNTLNAAITTWNTNNPSNTISAKFMLYMSGLPYIE